jgi:hypothetical protein
MGRGMWGLLLLALVATGWAGTADAQVPPVIVAPDPRSQQLWEGLANPCQGVRNALLRQGRNPSDPADSEARALLERAWASTLPVLVEIGAEPWIAHHPDTLAVLIDEQLRRPRYYASAEEVVAFLEDAVERGRAAVARVSATEPGLLLLAIIWSDPDRRDAWRYTAHHGWLRGAERDAALRAWQARSGGAGAELTRCQEHLS